MHANLIRPSVARNEDNRARHLWLCDVSNTLFLKNAAQNLHLFIVEIVFVIFFGPSRKHSCSEYIWHSNKIFYTLVWVNVRTVSNKLTECQHFHKMNIEHIQFFSFDDIQFECLTSMRKLCSSEKSTLKLNGKHHLIFLSNIINIKKLHWLLFERRILIFRCNLRKSFGNQRQQSACRFPCSSMGL